MAPDDLWTNLYHRIRCFLCLIHVLYHVTNSPALDAIHPSQLLTCHQWCPGILNSFHLTDVFYSWRFTLTWKLIITVMWYAACFPVPIRKTSMPIMFPIENGLLDLKVIVEVAHTSQHCLLINHVTICMKRLELLNIVIVEPLPNTIMISDLFFWPRHVCKTVSLKNSGAGIWCWVSHAYIIFHLAAVKYVFSTICWK